jgi:hypothetical protein
MNLSEVLRLALSSLSANKLRSGLTMLGIAVGVFSVIGVMTVITGLRDNIESGLNVLGANSFQISKFPAINFSDPWVRFRNRRDITYAQSARFKEMMRGSAEVALMLRRGARRVSHLDRRTNPNVALIGGDENAITSRNFEIAAGRNLGPDDVEFGCGATLAKWAAAGCTVHHLVCTDGSKGTWDVNADTRRLVDRRQAEQREAARRLSGAHAGEVVFLGHVDGELDSTLEVRSHEGRGTLFSMRLPLAVAEVAA